ncbi:MAG: relaxase domain-containing protein, partial [Streptomycetaceae bacterium]|nr:relaxase domain-containing protein [Streptomycetaceae bacterium]
MLSISTGSDPGYLTKAVGQGAEHYYLRSIDQHGEPPGVWLGDGAPELGLSGEVSADVMTDLYTDFIDPRKRDEMHERIAAIEAEKDSPEYREQEAAIRAEARLGSAPKTFEKSFEKRLAAKLEAEPDATPERRRELTLEARKQTPSATLYYDLTFSAPKSWSVFHASLQVQAGQAREAAEAARTAGDDDRAALMDERAEYYAGQADKVWDAWMEGVQAGLEYMQSEAGYSRAGHHGQKVAGRATGRYVEAHEFTAAAFRQHTSRNDDPQMHVHVAVLAKVKTVDVDPVTGEQRTVWRALDGQGLYKHKQAAGHLAERVGSEALDRTMSVRSAMRPDGKAREIVGIGQEKRDAFSSRRVDIVAGTAELAAAFEERHGYPPGPYQLARMSEHVTLEKRRAKSHDAVPREVMLDRWEAMSKQHLRASLADVPTDVALESSMQPSAKSLAMYFEPSEIQARAVAAVQERKASWTRPDLLVELNRQLPDTLGGLEPAQVRDLLNQLADDALTPGSGTGAVNLVPPPVVEVPVELQRADGSSVFAPNPSTWHRYTQLEHLRTEERIAAFAERGGAPAISAEAVEAVIERRKLQGAQAEFVRGTATSGRQVDVLVGPAGAGKSYAMAALTEAWESQPGHRVLGLASGQRASDVLAEEGIERTANIAKFLTEQTRIAEGAPVDELYRVGAGDLVIVDEAGMTSTQDLDAVRAIVEAHGAKLVLSGDHGQLSAVGAGGMFGQLATDLDHAYTLDEVRRFHDVDPVTGEKVVRQWEADASLQLREGDASALHAYETYGRLRGGSAEEMIDRAYRGWVTDYRDGRNALLIAPTNKMAAELSARARADLVRAGLVEAGGVRLRTGDREDVQVETVAGRGDMVQLRRNDRQITDERDEAFAVNRLVGTVVDRTADGGLTVRLEGGVLMALPAEYVAEHVELAYASTVYGAQGRTVEVCHSLIDPTTTRELFYVAISRGQGGNWAYVITHDPATVLQPGQEIPDHLAILREIVERQTREQTATQDHREQTGRVDHLAAVLPEWERLHIEDAEKRFGTALRDALGDEQYQRLQRDESEYGSLLLLAQHAEEQGRDAADMLVRAALSRELDTARSPAAVLHDRLEKALDARDQADAAADRAAQRAAVEAQRQRVSDVLNHAAGAAEGPQAAQNALTDPKALEAAVQAVVDASAGREEPEQAPETPEQAARRAALDRAADRAVLPEGQQVDAVMRDQLRHAMAFQGLEVAHATQDSSVRQQQIDAREARAEELDSYLARTRDLGGSVGEYARRLAAQMDARTEALGWQAVQEQPAWALDRLGPVPDDPIDRAKWEQKAGRIARYREAHGYQHEHDAIGPQPARGTVTKRATWERALRALGIREDQDQIVRSSDAHLRDLVDRYRREEAWAPQHVADDLQKASLDRDDYRVEAKQVRDHAKKIAQREATEHAVKSARHDQHVADVVTRAQTGPQPRPAHAEALPADLVIDGRPAAEFLPEPQTPAPARPGRWPGAP